MGKIGLIIKREYLVRVTKKSFILATLLTPIAIGLFGFLVGKIMSYKDDKMQKIAVIDQGDMMAKLKNTSTLTFEISKDSLVVAKQKILEDRKNEQNKYAGILYVPALADLKANKHKVAFYTDKRLNTDLASNLKDAVGEALREYKVAAFKLDTFQIKALKTRIEIEPEPLSNDAKKNATSKTAAFTSILSIFIGVLMYMAVFIYGSMVMRSVMEEKMNRIVEVMISSVKPFELMLGKIIGVGLVGLTQMVIWVILLAGVTVTLQTLFGADPAEMQQLQQAQMANMAKVDAADMQSSMGTFLGEFQRLNWFLIIPTFLIYFLAGYLLYSALFAAVGSAIGDDLGEGQSLTLPISLPVIMAVYISINVAQNPDSPLAVFSSLFPLFSPTVGPARLAAEPPLWQIGASLLLLIATTIFLVWLSGRIYRVGILMYGKKATFKELAKWIFYKD